MLLQAGISKREHTKALKRTERFKNKEKCYIGFLQNIRDIHLGMGLRKMYNQFESEDIGRYIFIVLDLQAGFRLRTVNNPTRTTFSIKHNRYVNLLQSKRFTDVNHPYSYQHHLLLAKCS